MKDYLIFAIYMYLHRNPKTTAQTIADEFEISKRSVYRYIDSLTLLGIPIITKIGKGGGIQLLGEYYLEGIALTKQEKEQLLEYITNNSIPENIKKIINKLLY